jgi:hypothetical protein
MKAMGIEICSSSWRTALVGVLALPAITLTTRDAHAAQECGVVDGPDRKWLEHQQRRIPECHAVLGCGFEWILSDPISA